MHNSKSSSIGKKPPIDPYLQLEDYVSDDADDADDHDTSNGGGSPTEYSFQNGNDLVLLNVTEFKQLVLAFSTIVGVVLKSGDLPVEGWLQAMENDIIHGTTYDEHIRTLLNSWRDADWINDVEATLAFVYLKQLVFTVAAEVVRRQNEGFARRWVRNLRSGFVACVPSILRKTTLTAMTLSFGTFAGYTMGKRVVRYFQ